MSADERARRRPWEVAAESDETAASRRSESVLTTAQLSYEDAVPGAIDTVERGSSDGQRSDSAPPKGTDAAPVDAAPGARGADAGDLADGDARSKAKADRAQARAEAKARRAEAKAAKRRRREEAALERAQRRERERAEREAAEQRRREEAEQREAEQREAELERERREKEASEAAAAKAERREREKAAAVAALAAAPGATVTERLDRRSVEAADDAGESASGADDEDLGAIEDVEATVVDGRPVGESGRFEGVDGEADESPVDDPADDDSGEQESAGADDVEQTPADTELTLIATTAGAVEEADPANDDPATGEPAADGVQEPPDPRAQRAAARRAALAAKAAKAERRRGASRRADADDVPEPPSVPEERSARAASRAVQAANVVAAAAFVVSVALALAALLLGAGVSDAGAAGSLYGFGDVMSAPVSGIVTLSGEDADLRNAFAAYGIGSLLYLGLAFAIPKVVRILTGR